MDSLDCGDEGGVGSVCGHGAAVDAGGGRGQARCQAVRLRLVVGVSAVMMWPAWVVMEVVVVMECDGMETKG